MANKSCRHTVYAGSRKPVGARTEPIVVLRLWIIEYNLKNTGKGCAVVKAPNAKRAEEILKTGGMYNGTPSKYEITRIEEIICPPAEDLIAEQNLALYES